MTNASKNKILLTGASGFLGHHIFDELNEKYQIVSLGRRNLLRTNHITADISDSKIHLSNYGFDLVIHAAGKAHMVPKSRIEREQFFKINHKGTVNLLQGLSTCKVLPKSYIFISTAAVYGKEKGVNIDETTPLEATDPYGLSKIKAEGEVLVWGKENGVRIGILRLPLIVGENPPGNLGAMISAIRKGFYFNVGDGSARRSMVLAKDVAEIIEKVADKGGIYNLTDGYHPSYHELSSAMAKGLDGKKVKSMPVPVAKLMAFAGTAMQDSINLKLPFNQNTYLKLTSSLTFSDQKARDLLNWNPHSVLEKLSPIL